VEPVEAAWPLEAEPHALPGLVVLDPVADGTVPSSRPDLQRSIKPHRRPAVAWPEPVVVAGEGVEQASHLPYARRACQPPTMHVADVHRHASEVEIALLFQVEGTLLFMPMPARYSTDELLDAALALFVEGGLHAVTMAGVARAVGAPSGSLYHRFAGRSALLASLWLRAVDRFQEGYLEALTAPVPVGAAHRAAAHVLRWVREHPVEALLLLTHGPDDVLEPDTPAEFTSRHDAARRRLEDALAQLRSRLPGQVSPTRLRFAVIDLPYAAVRPYLQQGQPLPAEVDELVAETLDAVLSDGGESP
jgi:AcrR family transcriptional regulator